MKLIYVDPLRSVITHSDISIPKGAKLHIVDRLYLKWRLSNIANIAAAND